MKLFLGPLLPPVHGQSLAFTRFVENVEENNISIINTNFDNCSKLGKIFKTFVILIRISFKALLYKYDVVYFTCSRSFSGSIKDVLLLNLVSLRSKKIINHLHGSDFYDFLHGSPIWYKRILFHSYKKVNTSIVLLESMRNQFRDFGEMNIAVVPNFYDKELDKDFFKKSHNEIRLVYLSNIMRSKGVFELIEAFERLSQKYKNISLEIAGDFIGDEFSSANETKSIFYKKIKDNEKIIYQGKVFGKMKTKLLQRSDIFVLPSYYKSEAFPISIIEAMVCGNLIVTTNYKYLPEIIGEENGVLVEPKDIEGLEKKIKDLLDDITKMRSIQRHNKKYAQTKYSLDNYLRQLKQIVIA